MRRILVVDDDPHICLAIRTWLKRYGFRVATADGGVNGLAALDNSTFDLMIVDIFMPNMRGFEPIRVFHNHAPSVPLIAISGYAFSGPEASGPDFLRLERFQAKWRPVRVKKTRQIKNLKPRFDSIETEKALAIKLGATRCLRKPFRPATLLGVIDECLSESEPHRKYVATLAAVTSALSEDDTKSSREEVFAN